MQTLIINKHEKSNIKLHIGIALLCLPLYIFGGEFFKYIMMPYVMYMIFAMQPKFIPALLLHFMNGSSLSSLGLLGCLIVAVFNFKKLKDLSINSLLVILLMLLPLMMYMVYIKITIYHEPFVVWLNYLSMYLGFFPFFYFALMASKFKEIHLKYIFISLGFSVILQLVLPIFILYIFYSLPLFICLIYLGFKKHKVSRKYRILLPWLIFLVLIIFWQGSSITLLFSSVISILFIFLYIRKGTISPKLSVFFNIVTFIVLIYSIATFDTKTHSESSYDIETNTLDVTNFKSIAERADFKLFEDRAPLWNSIYKNFILEGSFLPPNQMEGYQFETNQNSEFESEIAAHNIYLELIRVYGILVGLALSLIYIIMILKSSLLLTIANINSYLLAIAASIISCGFFAGMTGQFMLLLSFSFLFIGLAGLCYGTYKNHTF